MSHVATSQRELRLTAAPGPPSLLSLWSPFSVSPPTLLGLSRPEHSALGLGHTHSMHWNSGGREATWHRGAPSGLQFEHQLAHVLPVWPWWICFSEPQL